MERTSDEQRAADRVEPGDAKPPAEGPAPGDLKPEAETEHTVEEKGEDPER